MVVAVTLTAMAPASPASAEVREAVTARPESAPHLAETHLGPRFTASFRGEPLQHLLRLIEGTTPVRFRYAAPVDALVTEKFDNAPLWPTLEALLLKSGFHMQRSGESVFLFRNYTPPPAVTSLRNSPRPPGSGPPGRKTSPQALPVMPAAITHASWQYWTRPGAPPEGWTTVQPAQSGPVLIPGANPGQWWKSVDLVVSDVKSPGVATQLPSSASVRYLRWPMKLREIPLGAQLLVETPVAATLYVNGAPMFRRRSGRQLLDLSQVLHVGDNCLALEWQGAAAAPSLNFEWFFSERTS